MKTPLGTEVDLGPGHIVLDGVPAPANGAQQRLPLFGSCLLWPRSPISATAHPGENVTALAEVKGIVPIPARETMLYICLAAAGLVGLWWRMHGIESIQLRHIWPRPSAVR